MIPVNEPFLNGNEKKYLNDCIDSGWISSSGKYLELFENQMAKFVNRRFAFAVSNGTIAIDIAIHSLGLKKNDEVILPSFTIISCVNEIIRIGAKPIFVDADLNTFNIDTSIIEKKITKRTKAIMAVHIYGLPSNMDDIIFLCRKYDLKLIEDTAEAIGQKYNNQMCGSFGDISTTSFYANKHITTGEGGMVFTDNEFLAEKIKKYRNLGFHQNPSKRFIHESIGWNARLTNMQAAIGLAQLENIQININRKIKIGLYYTELLKDVEGLILPPSEIQSANNHFWVYAILIDLRDVNSEMVRKKLLERGIETRPFFYPLSMQPFFKNSMPACPNAEYLYEKGLYLPSGIGLEFSQIEYIVTELKNVIEEFKKK